ncbi:MAG: hypothetical protein CO030_05110 [Candidatus Magasanikbacteria bacterium CG_4_9_14_0_2_um_filter_42_11]|uniref:Thioredoxin domain-containing protein n=1 Tax=Candidatus Magasanikbacteria bacterium CG_4_9_14_0_2_um_filter_42_11 TaxID=1974643 RepID=A0A2M8F8K3_9BACT|nr:MAG: hypothetical protein COY70_00190 [Candidatus Magasanikbacteria bacterium CG_4_10_14_0_8_um_filter_42_12]PJC52009.1 MAG: hypothetical protein CO030_05110 [Candidatus Magasanikbacteria bacterium CG_4_9_14_0_2_um_filter_42_11]
MVISMNDSQFPDNPWYKTGGGIAFLGALGVLLAIVLGFGGLVGYYALQIKNGNGDQIQKNIQEARSSFSSDPQLTQKDTGIMIDDITPYIRAFNPQEGDLTSPVTIVAFIDFECPYCQASYAVFEQVRKKYDAGVHIIFKHFPLDSIHPEATQAALAASCAEEQHAFWEYYEQLFTKKDLSREALLSYAHTLGLNESVFEQCLSSKRYRSQILQDLQDGVDLGVRGTPTYFIGTTRFEGTLPLDVWDTQIIAAIQSHL